MSADEDEQQKSSSPSVCFHAEDDDGDDVSRHKLMWLLVGDTQLIADSKVRRRLLLCF